VSEIRAPDLAGLSDTGHMPFRSPPSTASWQHRGPRSGFEVAYFQAAESGWVIDGTTAAVEDGQTWVVTYSIELDAAWVTRSAHIGARTVSGSRETRLESDGCGRWLVNGAPAPDLNGCLDADLESSAMTNTLPIHRLDLPAGAQAASPAAYVRALDLTVERLEQTYLRIADQGTRHRYYYSAPAFRFTSCLVYDQSGLVIDYPGIALRAR
jgi:hypothetical protein